MRQSQLLLKTSKEAPKDAEVISHKLLSRADFISQLSSGIYSFLPLGYKVQEKIEKIIREELEAIGAQEILMPALQPKNIWEKTGRWNDMEPPLFKLRDRHKKELALGPTHEEVITILAAKRIKTFKDLPLALFQIQTKFRNEMRPSGGLLRTREFLMKDLYSFHSNEEDFKKYYEFIKKVYQKIFKRVGLKTIITEASGAGFTKEYTHEFQVIAPSGEDTIIFCTKGHFAQNKEVARFKEGNKCPVCGSILKKARAVEVGNIFPLGDKYSRSLDAYFIDRGGKKKPLVMGCYGIGLGRVMATIVEIHHDEKGIIWPEEVAPFQIHLIGISGKNSNDAGKIKKTTEEIYKNLQKEKIEVLYDDGEEKTPGEKLVEADLIGIPTRVVVSERTLSKNSLEIKKRSGKGVKLIKINKLVKFLKLKS
jgi:prolyl-tRNA synthetase